MKREKSCFEYIYLNEKPYPSDGLIFAVYSSQLLRCVGALLVALLNQVQTDSVCLLC